LAWGLFAFFPELQELPINNILIITSAFDISYMEPLFVADKIIDQWFTGSGIWSPIRPDIGNFLDLDWITFSLQLDLEPDYPNEINCDHRKNLKWINSFMKKKYTISK